MRIIFPTLAMSLMLAGGTIATATAERDLGLHRIDGAVDLIWSAREADDSGHWSATYSMRGRLDPSGEGSEMLLAGWDFRCDGMMSGAGERIEEETGTCRFEGEAASHFVAAFTATPSPWGATALLIGFRGGSGAYRTLRGEGTIERQMRLPFAEPVGWGFLTGAIAWRRD